MKRIRTISAMLLLLCAGICMAQNSRRPEVVWNQTISQYSQYSRTLQINEVRIFKDRTELSVHVDYVPGYWIRINDDLYIQADGKQYALKAATVITIGQEFWMPETGEVDFVLTFEPVPADTGSIDFIEPDGWVINNIRNAAHFAAGIEDTYWRDSATGDWVIGFTPECVIYDSMFWDIAEMKESNGSFKLTVCNKGISLPIEVGPLKKGKRSIVVAGESYDECTQITTSAMPDYPHKDMRKGFKDTGYQEGETVTFVGWLKDMPEEFRKMKGEFEISYENILNDENETAYAKMDSLGRFSITMPLLNTTEVFLDWQRTTLNTLLEPGETYFFLFDFSTGQKIFMGSDARLQNELVAHPILWDSLDIDEERGKADPVKIWKEADEIRARKDADLQNTVNEHPELSERYIDFVAGYYLTNHGESMMQARFYMPNMDIPEDYLEYVTSEFWHKRRQPYTMYRDFNIFLRDYTDNLNRKYRSQGSAIEIILELEDDGKLTLTDTERDMIKQYPAMLEELERKIENATEEEQKTMVYEFNSSDVVKTVDMVVKRNMDLITESIEYAAISASIEAVDSAGCDRMLRDLHIARMLYDMIDGSRKPLSDKLLKIAENEINLPVARKAVQEHNAKYLAIRNRKVDKSDNLKSSDVVKDMSDGEKILRKLIDPYKGKVILIDIWGVWCGPCRAALSHSQELYEHMKEYDIVFMYLANRSKEESWKNIIKEYNVTGENVVHYNLPEDQQSAVENFLNVHAWPTYILVDPDGNILDVNANPTHLDAFAELVDTIIG